MTPDGTNSNSGGWPASANVRSKSPRLKASSIRRTNSTFSCDIPRQVSRRLPTRARPLCRSEVSAGHAAGAALQVGIQHPGAPRFDRAWAADRHSDNAAPFERGDDSAGSRRERSTSKRSPRPDCEWLRSAVDRSMDDVREHWPHARLLPALDTSSCDARRDRDAPCSSKAGRCTSSGGVSALRRKRSQRVSKAMGRQECCLHRDERSRSGPPLAAGVDLGGLEEWLDRQTHGLRTARVRRYLAVRQRRGPGATWS
jgi:hypothetical protein